MGNSAVAKPQHFRVQREGLKTSFREMHLDTSSQAKSMFSPPQIVKSPGYSFADHEQIRSVVLKSDDPLHEENGVKNASPNIGFDAKINSLSRTSPYSSLKTSPFLNRTPEHKERSPVQMSPAQRSPLQELNQQQTDPTLHQINNNDAYRKYEESLRRQYHMQNPSNKTITPTKSIKKPTKPRRRPRILKRSKTSNDIDAPKSAPRILKRSKTSNDIDAPKSAPRTLKRSKTSNDIDAPKSAHAAHAASASSTTTGSPLTRAVSMPALAFGGAIGSGVVRNSLEVDPRSKSLKSRQPPSTDAKRAPKETDGSDSNKLTHTEANDHPETETSADNPTPDVSDDFAGQKPASSPEETAETSCDFLPLLSSSSVALAMYPNSLEHRHRISPNRIMNSARTVTSLFSNALPKAPEPSQSSFAPRSLFAANSLSFFARANIHAKFSPRLPANGPADPDIHRCLTRVSVFIIRCVRSTPGVPDDDVPTVEFLVEFLMALFRVEQIETPCCVLLYIYLKRLQASNMVCLNAENWRSALIGASLLSTKFFDDFSTKNSDFAVALSEYDVKDINKIEAAFLVAIDWRLHVTRTEYTNKYFYLLNGRTTRVSCVL